MALRVRAAGTTLGDLHDQLTSHKRDRDVNSLWASAYPISCIIVELSRRMDRSGRVCVCVQSVEG